MSLSSQFHGDRDGGTKVYRLIARASEDPQGQHDLIRLYFRVMCLGFKGYYRTQPDGDQQHRMACRKLYDLLAPFQPPVPKELSINIAPTRERNFYPMRLIPFPVTIAVYALALLALYGYFRYELHVKEKRYWSSWNRSARWSSRWPTIRHSGRLKAVKPVCRLRQSRPRSPRAAAGRQPWPCREATRLNTGAASPRNGDRTAAEARIRARHHCRRRHGKDFFPWRRALEA